VYVSQGRYTDAEALLREALEKDSLVRRDDKACVHPYLLKLQLLTP